MNATRSPLPSVITAAIDDFTGRTWLLPRLLDWLDHGDERILLLTGGPGAGKSMIMAWLAGYGPVPVIPAATEQLAALRGRVKAVHFCVAASGSTDPKALASEMAHQLTRNVPGFGQALATTLGDQVRIVSEQQVGSVTSGGTVTGVYIANLNLIGLSEELSFNRILRDPLKRLYQDGYKEPMLLLIDALDEALTYSGSTNIVRLLAKLTDLPPQVRILATTRPDPRVLMFYREARRLDLIEDAPPDSEDVRRYALARLASVSTGLDEAGQARLAGQVATKAAQVFLYAALVLDDLLPRLPGAADLDAYPLPESLSDIYHRFLMREVGVDDSCWYELYEPLLGMIAVAQGDGLTTAQLTALVHQDVRLALRASRQYLTGDFADGPFRPFHKSFADFLLEDKNNVDRHIDGAAMHRRIAGYYWQTSGAAWSTCDEYGLNSLPVHLAHCGDTGRLSELLLDPAWLQVKLDHAGFVALLADYDLLPGDPDLRLVQETIRLSSDVLVKDSRQLFTQLYGRLMTQERPVIQAMLSRCPPGPWLRPLTATLTPAGSALLQRLDACSQGVSQLALMPGGEQVLSANRDGKAEVWDLQRGSVVRSLLVDATSMVLTPPGDRLVYDWDGRLFICDVASGTTNLLTLEAHAPLALTSDGKRLVAAMRDVVITSDIRVEYPLTVWDLQTGDELLSLPGHARQITALAAMPDGRHVVSGAMDCELKVWDLATQTLTGQFKPYDYLPITAVLVVSDGRYVVVAAGGQGLISAWEVERLPAPQEPASDAENLPVGVAPAWDCSLESAIQAMAVTPDGTRLALGLNNGAVVILDAQAGTLICRLPGHERAVSALVATLDSRRLVSSSVDGSIKIWDLDRVIKPERSVSGHAAPVNAVAISSDGRMAVTAAGSLDREDYTLKVWDLRSGAELHLLRGHLSPVERVILLPDGRRAVSCSSETGRGDADTRLWNLETGALLGDPMPWRGTPKALAITPDGRQLIGAFSNFVSVLNLDDGSDQMLCCRERDVCAVVVTLDGRYALIADTDDWVVGYDLVTGEQFASFHGPVLPLENALLVAADDRLVLRGANDLNPTIWNWRSGRPIQPLEGHETPVWVAAMTPDGRRILSGALGGTIILWDVETGARLREFEPCREEVQIIAIAANGQHAVSVSADEALAVWDLSTGRLLARAYLDRPARACAISPDGTVVLAGDDDGRVTILRLERD